MKPLPDLQPLLGLDFDKEDRAYQRVAAVLEHFPRLASKPVWDLVNPSAGAAPGTCWDTTGRRSLTRSSAVGIVPLKSRLKRTGMR